MKELHGILTPEKELMYENSLIKLLNQLEIKGKEKYFQLFKKADVLNKIKVLKEILKMLNVNETDFFQNIDILKRKDLYEVIDTEFDKKIQGEKVARKSIFFTFNMRNVANLTKATDNLMINDEGGTGKDYVTSAVFEILPDDEKVKRVRITPKVLVYLNDITNNPDGWTKKCLYLEDVPNEVLNDDSFKVMSSADSNSLTETSIVINNKLKDIKIKGKPSIVLTVAAASPKQELLRRYPICNLTSTVNQTKAILKKQAKFAQDGLSLSYDVTIKQSLSRLRRIKVKIPFAEKISDIFPDENVIIRTHFPRFLDYIKSSCSLYQFQREKDEYDYFIATERDYEHAREIMTATTSNQLMIPLTKVQRRILDKFQSLETKTYTFQELETEMQNICASTWLRKQLDKLVEFGFLKRNNEKREHSIKPLTVYSYNQVLKLELPSFKELKYCENNVFNENNENSVNSENKGDKPSLSNLHKKRYFHTTLNSEALLFDEKCNIWQPCVFPISNDMPCNETPCNEFERLPYCKKHFEHIQRGDRSE